ncbi:MAG: RND transporter [Proteobacteria bacterium]|nr:MAG: RND transporter [Pseudomonadota bacterium]
MQVSLWISSSKTGDPNLLRSKLKIVLAALSLVVPGCAWIPSVGPDYEPPDTRMQQAFRELPGGELTSEQREQLASWWRELGDPDLDNLIEMALKDNFDLKIALSRAAQARAQRRLAAGDFYPQIESGAGFTRSESSQNAFGPSQGNDSFFSPGATKNFYDTGLDSTWEIDIFGGNRRAFEAASADYEAALQLQRDVLVSLLAEVVGSFYEVRSLDKRVGIAKKNIEIQRESAEIVQSRYDAGLASELDLSQAKAQLESTKAILPLIEVNRVRSRNSLSILLGRSPDGLSDIIPVKEEAESSILNTAYPEKVLSGVPSELLRNRPDIRAAERNLAASSARIGVAISDLYPKFTLAGSFGYSSDSSSSWFESASRAWSFGPSFSWPIFAGGKIVANIEVQREREKEALAAYGKTIIAAIADAENSLSAFQREHARFDSLTEALAQNQRALELSKELYTQGLADFLRVLDAERETFQAEEALAISESQLLSNFARVYKALGFGGEANMRP